jgi:hypothetical protein
MTPYELSSPGIRSCVNWFIGQTDRTGILEVRSQTGEEIELWN